RGASLSPRRLCGGAHPLRRRALEASSFPSVLRDDERARTLYQKFTHVPAPVSLHLSYRNLAAARSSTASPSDSNSVISSFDVRPGLVPLSTSPNSARM